MGGNAVAGDGNDKVAVEEGGGELVLVLGVGVGDFWS